MPLPRARRIFRGLVFWLSLALFLFHLLPCRFSASSVREAPSAPSGLSGYCGGVPDPWLTAEEELDLRCLLAVYPSIRHSAVERGGAVLLIMEDGRRVPYRSVPPDPGDVKESMRQPYPPEPLRPATPEGVAPGRQRSPALLEALYGSSRREVQARLVSVPMPRGSVAVHQEAAGAFGRVAARLREALRRDPSLRPWLKPDGGFAWRRIAGETRRSAHAYGIAVDLSACRAPYWRWGGPRPHPLQWSYPAAIVRAFEAEGFIWGGKWHEYDIMHFEYRPELLCKARSGQ